MTEHFAVIQQQTRSANAKISKQVSDYTTGLRKRLKVTTDYGQDFDEVFGKFTEGRLPKDELYWQIKQELEQAAKAKAAEKNPKGNKRILPTTHATKMEAIQHDMHKGDVAREIKAMEERGEGEEIKKGMKLDLLDKLEEQRAAFTGDFSALDDELRVQVIALNKGDLETVRRLRNSELPAAEIQYYLADAAAQKELEMDKDQGTEPYDSDLNRSLYQEYWTDLKEFKPKVKKEKKRTKSVVPGRNRDFSGRTAASLSHISMSHAGTPLASGDMPGSSLSQRRQSKQTQLPSIFLKEQSFVTDIQDPFADVHKKVDKAFIAPQKKFDTIFDEYVDKQKQFDHLRNQANKPTGDSLKNERDMLKNKIETLIKTQNIELRHAKETARNQADKMLREKLAEAKFAYEEELEHICKQFEEMQKECEMLKTDKIHLKNKIYDMEQIITNYNDMVECSGYKLNRKQDKKKEKPNKKVTQAVEKLHIAEMKEQVPENMRELFEKGKSLLRQEFNGFSFGIYLNYEQMDSIMHDVYNRYLQQQLLDMNDKFDILSNELNSTRKMTKQFKANQEVSNKKIAEIQLRYESVKEEMKQKVLDADQRLNLLIRDFVTIYKKLAQEFVSYKDYVLMEMQVFEEIVNKKNDKIAFQQLEVNEYKECLRIPRQHYKHIENLKFEELVDQKNSIIKRLTKKYGYNPTAKGNMNQIQMPDPSLPIHQQLEMVENGGVMPGGAQQSPTAASGQGSGISGQGYSAKTSPRGMQRDFSIFSIMSKTTTADSRFQSELQAGKSSLVMSPSFRYGLHKKQQSPTQSIRDIVTTKNPFLSRKNENFTKSVDRRND